MNRASPGCTSFRAAICRFNEFAGSRSYLLEDAREMRFHFPEHSDATVTMTSLSVDEINDPSAVNSIKHADAIIYAGMRALHKKALEVEFLPGFSAGTLLKNLTRLLQDHRCKTH